MSEPAQLAKSAREQLASALNALQSSDEVPQELMDLAEPIAEAMGILHRIERSNGATLDRRDEVLTTVRTSLDRLQKIGMEHPAIDAVMEAVASSLSKIHALVRYAPPAPAAAPVAAQPAFPQPSFVAAVPAASPLAAPQPFAAPPPAAPPQPFAAPSPFAAPPPPASPPPAAGPPPYVPVPITFAQPAAPPAPFGNTAPIAPSPIGAAYPSAQQPMHPAQQQAYPGMSQPIHPAQQQHPQGMMESTGPLPEPGYPAYNPGPFGPPPQAGPQQGPPAHSAPGAAPAANAYRAPQKGPGSFDVELGTQSASNFYKGLAGNDVIEHGGIFVATYKIPPIGADVVLRVLLPGDLEFQATAVVQWSREGTSGEGAEPGFGARFTHITPEGRQLVYRYTRNREPIFYDDL